MIVEATRVLVSSISEINAVYKVLRAHFNGSNRRIAKLVGMEAPTVAHI